MAFDETKPANTDKIKDFPALWRGDKDTLLTNLSLQHDFPTTGKHKDVSVISGNFSMHNGISRKGVAVSEDATSYVQGSLSIGTTDYAVFVEPSWATGCSISGQSASAFTINFSIKAPAAATVNWILIETGAT